MNNETIIEKANISLANGESLNAFSQKVGDAAQAKFGKKSTGPTDNGVWIWVRAIFKDSVVFEQNIRETNGRKLLQVNYAVDGDNVSFPGVPVEVREVMAFEPVAQKSTRVTLKRLEGFWSGLPITR